MAFNYWWLTLLGVSFAFIGTYYLVKTIPRSSEKLQKSLALLLLAALFGPPSHLIISYYGIVSLDVNNDLWNAIPVMFTLAMVFVVLSFQNLVELFERIERGVEEKNREAK
ncbi:MAG TPA: hypothetical protein VJA40_01940 [archaeon]|nr:hypothetical protein [archaeon]